MLPALGFGILLSMLATPGLIAWFFIGFLLSIFAKFSVVAAAFFGICAGAISIFMKGGLALIRPAEEAEQEVASMISPSRPTHHFLALVWPPIRFQL